MREGDARTASLIQKQASDCSCEENMTLRLCQCLGRIYTLSKLMHGGVCMECMPFNLPCKAMSALHALQPCSLTELVGLLPQVPLELIACGRHDRFAELLEPLPVQQLVTWGACARCAASRCS